MNEELDKEMMELNTESFKAEIEKEANPWFNNIKPSNNVVPIPVRDKGKDPVHIPVERDNIEPAKLDSNDNIGTL